MPLARINPSILNGPPQRIPATATSSSHNPQSVIVWSGDLVIDDTVSNTVNVNLSYDSLPLAGISAGILQDPSQESNMLQSPPSRQIPYSPLPSDFGESPVRDPRRVGGSPDISSDNVRWERPGRRNRARVSAAAAFTPPPCSQSRVASATNTAEEYYQVETK